MTHRNKSGEPKSALCGASHATTLRKACTLKLRHVYQSWESDLVESAVSHARVVNKCATHAGTNAQKSQTMQPLVNTETITEVLSVAQNNLLHTFTLVGCRHPWDTAASVATGHPSIVTWCREWGVLRSGLILPRDGGGDGVEWRVSHTERCRVVWKGTSWSTVIQEFLKGLSSSLSKSIIKPVGSVIELFITNMSFVIWDANCWKFDSIICSLIGHTPNTELYMKSVITNKFRY